jgi:peptidyl-prolyl cis-trans isomerase D
MTDPAFDDALFAMSKGTLSEPVLSAEGYHIIELRDVRPGSTRSFEEVRPDLVTEYMETEHDRVFNEKAGRLTDLTYQDPSSLEPAAHELGLTVQKTEFFPREGGTGIAANPDVVKAAFSDNVLVQGNNSDPISIGPEKVVVIRLAERKPAVAKPLAEVRDTIRERILAERIAKAAKERAEHWFAVLEKDGDMDAVSSALDVKIAKQPDVHRTAMNIDSALVGAAFTMPRPEAGKPVFRLVPLADDAYALVRLDAVTDGDPAKLDAKTREGARTALARARGTLLSSEFVDALRKNTEISIAEDRLP